MWRSWASFIGDTDTELLSIGAFCHLSSSEGQGQGDFSERVPMRLMQTPPSLPGLTRQSIFFAKRMDPRVKPAGDNPGRIKFVGHPLVKEKQGQGWNA
jgi:hypothetical protein